MSLKPSLYYLLLTSTSTQSLIYYIRVLCETPSPTDAPQTPQPTLPPDEPSQSPTIRPTESPETPPPSAPLRTFCGEQHTGTYQGVNIEFEFTVFSDIEPFRTRVILSACGSTFDTYLLLQDSDGNTVDECNDCGQTVFGDDCTNFNGQCCLNSDDGLQSELTISSLQNGIFTLTLSANTEPTETGIFLFAVKFCRFLLNVFIKHKMKIYSHMDHCVYLYPNHFSTINPNSITNNTCNITHHSTNSFFSFLNTINTSNFRFTNTNSTISTDSTISAYFTTWRYSETNKSWSIILWFCYFWTI